MHKRVMALLLSLVLLLSAAMPVTAMAAEGYAGSFVLVAMNANSTIVDTGRLHDGAVGVHSQQHHRGADPYPV